MARQGQQSRRAAVASLMGTSIEYYDFFIYGLAAALVFDKVFFPNHDPVVGTLLSLATFGIAFVARPIGGVVIGHFGDRIGRKSMLILTLTSMGGCTFLVGLLPSYSAIGVAAPITLILLRLVQGFALGGEYGGAVLMTMEHARPNRRGFYGSWVQAGAMIGLILANLAFLPFTALAPEAFAAWGWRVPFLLSIVLVGVGIAVRISISESPAFEELKQDKSTAKAPIMVVLRSYPKETMLVAGCSIAFGVAFYLMAVFGVSYGTGELGKSKSEMLTIILIAMGFTAVGLVFFGWLSDRVGRRVIFLSGSIGMALLAFPWIWLIDSKSFALTLTGYLLLCVPYSAAWGTAGVFFAERFETGARYSGISVGFTVGNIAGSAVAPLIATSLFAAFQSASAVGWYLVAMAAISIISAILLIETEPTRETATSEASEVPAVAP